MTDVSYENGILFWPKCQSQVWSLPLYSQSEGPRWFQPDQRNNPKVYFFKDMFGNYQGHWQVLIYNEKLAEAYIVEHQDGAW